MHLVETPYQKAYAARRGNGDSAVDFIEPAFGDDLLARGGAYGATIGEMQKLPSHKQQIHFAFNLRAAVWTVAALSIASGVIVATRMTSAAPG